MRVAGAAKEAAIGVPDATVHHEKGVGLRTRVRPLLLARRGVHGVRVIEECEIQDALHGHDTALEVHRLRRIEHALLLELADIGGSDLLQRRKAIAGKRSVVGDPVGKLRCRCGRGRGITGVRRVLPRAAASETHQEHDWQHPFHGGRILPERNRTGFQWIESA